MRQIVQIVWREPKRYQQNKNKRGRKSLKKVRENLKFVVLICAETEH